MNDCCRPLHRGLREAADPVSLMRSRFSAFALKEVEYLWRTLASEHEDRALTPEEALRRLRESASTHRYMGLKILDSRAPDAAGVALVLFLARVFQNGRDLSFVECSDFVREPAGWRYRGGTLRPVHMLSCDPLTLSIEGFTIAH